MRNQTIMRNARFPHCVAVALSMLGGLSCKDSFDVGTSQRPPGLDAGRPDGQDDNRGTGGSAGSGGWSDAGAGGVLGTGGLTGTGGAGGALTIPDAGLVADAGGAGADAAAGGAEPVGPDSRLEAPDLPIAPAESGAAPDGSGSPYDGASSPYEASSADSGSICSLPADPGPCKGNFLRYWYNQAAGGCEPFGYGGCEGNANQFDTLEACASACAQSVPSVDGGSALCTGTPVLGGLLPMTEPGTDPRSMALGDLNGDHALDIVTANQDTVSVLLGQGDGRFAAKTDYAIGYQPNQVALGDLNGDGNLDILVEGYYGVNDTLDVLSVLLGKGDGTFAAKHEYPAGDGANGLALGDLNGDGKLDVVTPDLGANQVGVLLGKGDGSLAARQGYPTGERPSAVALGDLDADGKLDLVAIALGPPWVGSSSVSVLLGKGDGTFAANTDFPLGYDGGDPKAWVALGDVNGDGKLDVVAAGNYDSPYPWGVVSVLLGKGDGSFGPPATLLVGDWLSSMSLFDFDDDGRPDLVLGLRVQATVGILFGQGDGTFAAPRIDYLTGGELQALAQGDLDGDGKTDLALAFRAMSYSSSGLSVLFGRDSGVFASPLAYPTASEPLAIALGDLNGDGKLDIASADSDADAVTVLLGEGDGTFVAAADLAIGDQPACVALGDLDGDGRLDVVTANSAANGVSVFLGMGDGTFASKADLPTASWPTWVALGDVNADGKLDIIVTAGNQGGSYVKGTVSVLVGTGGGKFAAHVDSQAGVSPVSLAPGDLDGDGKLDLVVANEGFDGYWSVGVLLGKGDGRFTAAADASGGRATSVALADLNGDGRLDLVMASDWDPVVSVLLGKGDGTFTAKVDYPTWGSVASITLGDMNGDAKLDVVAASGGAMEVLFGKGDGTFAARLSYATSPWKLALGDFNGDGRLDVASTAYPGSVNVLIRSCQ
jgi:hypothetical protein